MQRMVALLAAASVGIAQAAASPPAVAAAETCAVVADSADGWGGRDVAPVRVVRVDGRVADAAALAGGGGVATLARGPHDPAAVIVLDYGREVSGVPEFDVVAVAGHPRLRAGYAEALRFLGPDGDGGAGFESGDADRADVYRLDRAGLLDNRTIQGGERYQQLTLDSPGSVTLRRVRIRRTDFRGPFEGRFRSDSAALNRVWQAGADTLRLNMLPPQSPSGYWSVPDERLHDTGGGAGLLRTGTAWTDYTVTVDVRIDGRHAGLVVRGASVDTGATVWLDAADSRLDRPGAVRLIRYAAGRVFPAGAAAAAIAPGRWHTVGVAVRGNDIAVSVDGVGVGDFPVPGLPAAGTVGFAEATGVGESTLLRGLAVTSPDGTALYRNPLAEPAALDDFTLPQANRGALITDGAKRDRDVWEGDLSIAELTALLAAGRPEYVRDSLRLLGGYQLPSGFIEGRRAPDDPLDHPPLTGSVSQYSASYSMYFVDNLATYYQFTGDLAFVAAEWPVAQRELAWNATLVNRDGLLVTDAADGATWHYDVQTGAQTYDNAMYYRILLDAATLADALADPAAAGYRARAAALRDAVNNTLFDRATGGYDISTAQRGVIAQDANTVAVRYGIAPPGRVPGILAAMTAALATPHGDLSVGADAPSGYHRIIGPFMGSHELLARFGSGDEAGALDLLRREWEPMTAADPTGVLWEVLGPDGTAHTPGVNGEGDGRTSLAHAWSTGPTAALSEYVLGVTPVEPGFRTWRVAPRPGGLDWAQGRVPTPHGPLTVRWCHRAGRLLITVLAPPGTSGTVVAPPGARVARIVVDGRAVAGADQ